MDPVYISHGSPMLPLEDIPARDFLRRWREFMPQKPTAVLVISAHWSTSSPAVTVSARNTTIQDFYGFPRELYKLQYNAPGAPELAKKVKDLLEIADFHPVQQDSKWGLDHGAWVPLYLMYPDCDIPVCQLSVQPHKGGLHHYKMGRALARLKDEGVLIMASGSTTHNLRFIGGDSSPPPVWASEFDDWLNDTLVNGRFEEVIDFERYAPYARMAHPSIEHFVPLLVALGAAGENAKAQRIHASWAHETLSMASFSFSATSMLEAAKVHRKKELVESLKDYPQDKELVESPKDYPHNGNSGGLQESTFERNAGGNKSILRRITARAIKLIRSA